MPELLYIDDGDGGGPLEIADYLKKHREGMIRHLMDKGATRVDAEARTDEYIEMLEVSRSDRPEYN